MRKAVFRTVCMLGLCLAMASPLRAQRPVTYSINEAWAFSKAGEAEGTVSFPHTWNAADARDDEPGFYRGPGTYRKRVYIPDSHRGKTVYICFEGANQVTTLLVNGQRVGVHKGGYARFNFDITAYLQWGGDNDFEIAVTNAHDEAIPPLSADFTFFGGVYRDVYLTVKERLHISPTDRASTGIYVATPQVSETRATVRVTTLLNNGADRAVNAVVRHTVYDPAGRVVYRAQADARIAAGATNQVHETAFELADPALWSTETPQLYAVKTTVAEARTDRQLDEARTAFGLRWYRFSADSGFFLNGRYVKLIGTNRHQDFLRKGNALEDQYHVSDMRLLKAMGGNFIRISHYPQDPLVLAMCDRLGIVASVEIPIVNAVTERQDFLDNSLVMAEELVKQHFNHPSLVIWSYMNEVMLRPPYPATHAAYAPYCAEVNRQALAIERRIRELDDARYTMIAFHGSMKAYADAGLFDVPMIVGWNLYQGWYGEGFHQLDTFLAQYRSKYPDKPTILSEYGADVDTRIHSFEPERFDFSVEYGDLYHEHYLNTIRNSDFLAGAAIWNLNDFHSEPRNDAVPHINSKGITGLDRTPKNTFHLYRAYLAAKPFVKIASADWRSRSGVETAPGVSMQRIKVYANGDSVTVYHQGRVLASIPIVANVGEIDVPFGPGENRIEARTHGAADGVVIDFAVIPRTLGPDFTELAVSLGGKRFFEERDTRTCWIPEQAYAQGGWGYVGGEPYRAKTRFGQLPAAALNILGTDLDPLFQTQRVGIEQFKADVPDGQYAVYFHWADLRAEVPVEALAYNLGNDAIAEAAGERVFAVSINGVPVLERVDIPSQVGVQRALVKKCVVDVHDAEGITIAFEPIAGETILNAIKLLKIN